MTNLRCSNCGFLNFASASSCKRCKAELETAIAAAGNPAPFNGVATPQWNYQAPPPWVPPTIQTPDQSPYPPPQYFSNPIAPLPPPSKNGTTNAVLWSLLGLACAIGLMIGILWKFGKPASTQYAWQEYKAPDESFTILMPTKPVESIENPQAPSGIQLQMHISTADMGVQGAYMVGYVDYPDTFKKVSSETLLDAAANGAINRSGATLVSKKSITFDGYPGVELEMLPPAEAPPGMGHAFSRIYWLPPRLYMTFAGGPDSTEGNQRIVKFLDSFSLRKR